MEAKENKICNQTPESFIPHKASAILITIEPIMFLVMCFLGNVYSFTSQYLQRRIASDKYDNYTLPNTSNASCVTNASNKNFAIEQKIQDEASKWVLFISICGTFPPLISIIVIGAWSDIRGRKIALALPVFGCILQLISIIIVIAFHLPILILLAGAFALGVSGGYPLLLTDCLSYIADITTEEQRTFRIAIITTTVLVAMSSSQLSFGYFINATGFLAPCLVLLGLQILAFVYIITPKLLLETVEKDDAASISEQIVRIWIDVRMLFQVNTNGRRWKLGLLGILSFVLEIVLSGYLSIVVLYAIDEPFCWTSIQVGFFMSGTILFLAICHTIGAKVLPKFIPDVWILHICFTSLVASMVVVGLAETDLLLYLSSCVGCLRTLAAPVVRSIMSRTVESHEQGVMFSFVSSVVGAAEFVSPILLTSIYTATVFFEPSLVFYVAAGIAIIPMILICVLQVFSRNSYVRLSLHEVTEDAEIN